jgi:hypothetical protein
MVMFTQRLALQRDLAQRQTLTAIHDKSSAWLGIGSAVVGVVQQMKLQTAVWGVILIALYFLGVFTLHVSIPSLFHVDLFNGTNPITRTTILAVGNNVNMYVVVL